MVLRWLLHSGESPGHMIASIGIGDYLFFVSLIGSFPVISLAGFSLGYIWLIAATYSFLNQTLAHGMGLP